MFDQKNMRRSQLIHPFGVGAIVDFRHDTLMVAGLEGMGWYSNHKKVIREARLEKRLGVRKFIVPPAVNNDDDYDRVPFIRFPEWQFCPSCKKLDMFRTTRCDCLNKNVVSKNPLVIPVRFVAVCEKGHVQDFPWFEWVHGSSSHECCPDSVLNYISLGYSGLGGIRIDCKACGKKRTMAGASSWNALEDNIYRCHGRKPWLGRQFKESGCSETLHMVLRSASNLYFPNVANSILIPTKTKEEARIVADEIWSNEKKKSRLLSVRTDGKSYNAMYVEDAADHRKVPFEDLEAAIEELMNAGEDEDSSEISEVAFRNEEYQIFNRLEMLPDTSNEMVIRPRQLSDYSSFLSDYLSNIVMVEKLSETRALCGFTRLEPPEPGDFRKGREHLSINPTSWLPAYRVKGEGIFLAFREDVISEYLGRSHVKQRQAFLNRNFVESKQRFNLLDNTGITGKYLILHTFAHLLIRKLQFMSGYGSSALRERIYSADGNISMSGILIYTAAGDSEGTMGGLVHQGKPGRLDDVFLSAVQDAMWCSSDPLCIESEGQGFGNLNLSACHACTLLPETSCETGNRFLDRGLLVGNSDQTEDGFFSSLIR